MKDNIFNCGLIRDVEKDNIVTVPGTDIENHQVYLFDSIYTFFSLGILTLQHTILVQL